MHKVVACWRDQLKTEQIFLSMSVTNRAYVQFLEYIARAIIKHIWYGRRGCRFWLWSTEVWVKTGVCIAHSHCATMRWSNAHDEIGPRAIAAYAKLCVIDNALATKGIWSITLENRNLSAGHKTSPPGLLLSGGPRVAHPWAKTRGCW